MVAKRRVGGVGSGERRTPVDKSRTLGIMEECGLEDCTFNEPGVVGMPQLLCPKCTQDRVATTEFCCGCGSQMPSGEEPEHYSKAKDICFGLSLGIVFPSCMMGLAVIGLYTVGTWVIHAIWGS